jgi:hypothetical protein
MISDPLYLEAYGLVFASTLPYLDQHIGAERSEPTGREPDVVLRFGEVPVALNGAEEVDTPFQVVAGQSLLKIKGVGRYLVTTGKITVEPDPGTDTSVVYQYLFGTVLGALLHLRCVLALHGSAIGLGRSCAVIMGDTGVGKSTLATALAKRGYTLMADDISAVSVVNGIASVHPGLRRMKLAADALQRLDERLPAARSPGDKSFKYYLGFNSYSRQQMRPLPVGRVYLLTTGGGPRVELTPVVTGSERMRHLISNTYRLPFLSGATARERHFEQCAVVSEQSAFSCLTRPRNAFRLDELADTVAADLDRR